MAAYWIYVNRNILDTGYYAGTFEMSASEFAYLVSKETNINVTPGEIFTLKNEHKLYHHSPLKHIITKNTNR